MLAEVVAGTKWCGACQKEKPTGDFHRASRKRDGLACHCKDCRSAQHRRAYAENRERRLAQMRALYASDPGRKNRQAQQSRLKDIEGERARKRAWRERNRERWNEYNRRRRARLRGAPMLDLTAEQWEAIKEAHGHACAYCGRTNLPLTQDHIIPVSRGGAHTAKNIVPACRPCNSRKHDKEVAA